jgi:hypothetical protein
MESKLVKIGGIIAVISSLILIASGLITAYFLPDAIVRMKEEYEDFFALLIFFLSTFPPGILAVWIGVILLKNRILRPWEIRLAIPLLGFYLIWYVVISMVTIFTKTAVASPDRWLLVPFAMIFAIMILAVLCKKRMGGL